MHEERKSKAKRYVICAAFKKTTQLSLELQLQTAKTSELEPPCGQEFKIFSNENLIFFTACEMQTIFFFFW